MNKNKESGFSTSIVLALLLIVAAAGAVWLALSNQRVSPTVSSVPPSTQLAQVSGSQTPAFVQSASGSNDAVSSSISANALTTRAGDLLIAAVSWDVSSAGSITASVSDSAGNSWTSATSRQVDARNGQALQIFYAKDISGGSDIVTANLSSAGCCTRIIVHEISGADVSSPLDQTAVNNAGNGTALSVGPVTTSSAGEYIFAAAMNDGAAPTANISSSGSFVQRAAVAASDNELQTEDEIQSAAGSVSATWTLSASTNSLGQEATFKAPAAQSGAGGSTTANPPVISGVSVSGITSSGATISWTTDEQSTSQAAYGLTTAYGSNTALNSSLVTSHSVSLSDLQANTVYDYQVISTNSSAQTTDSSNYTFTTAAASASTPTASLSASPTSITSGQSSTLSWSSTNATACTGSGFTASGTTGSVSVSPANTTTYTMTCTGTGGTSPASSATVTVSAAQAATYAITASAGTGGSISPSGTVTVNSGANQSFTITPSSGYQVSSLTDNGTAESISTSGGTYVVSNVTASHTISVSFTQTAVSSGSCPAASGKCWYVDGSLSSNGNGTSWSSAWNSLSNISGVGAGDIVYISGGPSGSSETYSSPTNWSPIGGVSGDPIVYQVGQDSSHDGSAIITTNILINSNYVTLDGFTLSPSQTGPGTYAAYVYGEMMNGQYDTIQNCNFTNFNASASQQATMFVLNGSFDTVQNCYIHDLNDIDVFHVWGHNQTINHNYATDIMEVNYNLNHTDFFQTWGAPSYDIVIENNLITNSSMQLGNTDTYDGTPSDYGFVWRNNVIYNIANPLFSGLPNTLFYNNLFDNVGTNDGYAIGYYSDSSHSSAGDVFTNNVSLGTSAGPYSGGTGSNNISGSSLSALGLNGVTGSNTSVMSLSSNSPLINAGTSLSSISGSNSYASFNTDYYGVTRPQGSAWDVGPFEYASGGSVAPPTATYAITASAGTGGSISPSGTVTVNSGASQTFTFTPNSGYQVSSATVDGVVTTGSFSSYTFSNVTANHTISVAFSPTAVPDTTAPTVTAFTVPSTSSSLTIPITAFTATDNVGVTGYMITTTATAPSASASGWTATAPTSYTVSASGAYTLYAWAKDAAGNVSTAKTAVVTVTNAVSTYSVTTSIASGSGSITCGGTTCPSSVSAGTAETFTATPSSGYVFSGWGGSCSGTASTCQVTVNANTSVTATFTAQTASAGNTYYVSTTGSDSNSGSQSSPWLTISHAASTAKGGSTVYIGPGTYNESVTFANSGTSGSPITFTGTGTASCANGSQAGLCPTATITGNVTVNGNYVTLNDITVNPVAPIGSAVYGMEMNGQYDTFSNSLFNKFGTGTSANELVIAADQATAIILDGSYDTVESSTIRDISDIDVFHIWGNNHTIKGNYITNILQLNYNLNHTDFFQTWGGPSYNVMIDGNVITNSTAQLGNTECDPGLCSSSYGWTIRNNIFADDPNTFYSGIPTTLFYNNVFYDIGSTNGAAVLFYTDTTSANLRSSSGSAFINNLLISTPSVGTSLPDGGSSDFSSSNVKNNYTGSNPMVTNAAAYDFYPLAGSPLIGAGIVLSPAFADIAGNPRPTTGAWDIGAYEYQASGVGSTPAPTASLSASPSSITSGQSSTLSWSSTNATACTGSGFTASGTTGSVSVSPTVTTSYGLTCTGAGGTSPASTAAVTVSAASTPPSTTFSVGQGVQAYDTGTSGLSVRSSPSATASTVSGSPVANGTVGTVTAAPSGTTNGTYNGGYYWWYVTYSNGVIGWSAETYLEAYTAPATYTVNVISSSVGGNVTSSPAGISCGASGSICSMTQTVGSSVTLTASPVSGYTTSWSGCGSTTTGNTCAISSAASVTATFTAVPDTTAPTVTAFTVPSASSSLTIPITAFTATDNVGVTGYMITTTATAPSASASGWTATAPTSYTVSASGAYTLYAWAKDAAGNVSTAKTAVVTVVITAATTPPSAPTNIKATSLSNEIDLSWTASTAGTYAVSGYNISRCQNTGCSNFSQIATAAGASYDDTSLTSDTSYTYSISAHDSKGDVSQAAAVTVSTQPPSATVPIIADSDGDGVPDSSDLCPNTPAGDAVNTVGCPMPIASNFNVVVGGSPLSTASNLLSAPSFSIGDSYGTISYLSANGPYAILHGSSSAYSPTNINADVTIGQGTVSVNSAAVPELDKPAQITLYNIIISPQDLKILQNGAGCATCDIVSYTNNTLVFNVPGFSTYSIVSTVSIGTVPPSVSLSFPANGGSVSGSVALSATASDNATLAGVQFMLDGSPLGSYIAATTSNAYSEVWDTTQASNGTHTISAVANDTSGNYATSTVTIMVNNVVTAPVSGSGGTYFGGGGGYVPPTTGTSTASTTCATSSSALPAYVFTLGIGSRGTDVSNLQTFLVISGYLKSQYVTGYFGPLTQAALNAYLTAHPSSSACSTTISQQPPNCPVGLVCTPIATGSTSTSTIPLFTSTMKIGSYGQEVYYLQVFLNTHGFQVAFSGNGSPGHESMYYGPATAAAVSRFQVAYTSQILAPYGLTQGTGNFGLSTMRVVNAIITSGN